MITSGEKCVWQSEHTVSLFPPTSLVLSPSAANRLATAGLAFLSHACKALDDEISTARVEVQIITVAKVQQRVNAGLSSELTKLLLHIPRRRRRHRESSYARRPFLN